MRLDGKARQPGMRLFDGGDPFTPGTSFVRGNGGNPPPLSDDEVERYASQAADADSDLPF